MHPSTEIIHGSTGRNRDADPLTTPIYETTTFIFENAAEVTAFNQGTSKKFLYSRYGNPTVTAVEETVARVEGAETAMLLASGMAATSTALLGLLRSGDEGYDEAPSSHPSPPMGERVAGGQVRGRAKARLPLTRLFTKPAVQQRPNLIPPSSGSGTRNGRNTFASPLNQQPIALGVDIVMESVTKYLNGHSDVTAGAIAGPAHLLKDIDKTRRLLGGIVDPQAAYAIGRGIKTLSVRMERHNANGLAVARWLESQVGKRVEAVFYPGLESHPDHALAKKQMKGFGGMVCVDVGGGQPRAERFFDRLKLFKRAASLGGVESLCSLPALTSQWGHTDAQLAQAGVTRSMARLSVGLEDPQDLIEDLDQAL